MTNEELATQVRAAVNALIQKRAILEATVRQEGDQALVAVLATSSAETADALSLEGFPVTDFRHVEVTGAFIDITYLL